MSGRGPDLDVVAGGHGLQVAQVEAGQVLGVEARDAGSRVQKKVHGFVPNGRKKVRSLRIFKFVYFQYIIFF
jgi:hypothetical protein